MLSEPGTLLHVALYNSTCSHRFSDNCFGLKNSCLYLHQIRNTIILIIKIMAYFYFLLPIYGSKNNVFGSNFQNF